MSAVVSFWTQLQIMLLYDQAVFAGLLVLIYFISLCFNRRNVQWLIHILPETRLCVKTELHLVQMIFSLICCVIVFGYESAISTLLSASIIWALHRLTSAKLAQPLTWISTFTWLSYLHLNRPEVWTPHITGSVMLMTIRYTSYASDRKAGLTKTGSLPEWLGWSFFIPSFFTGPTTSLEEYRAWHAYVNNVSKNVVKEAIEDTCPANKTFVRALWYAPFVIIGQMTFPAIGVTRFEPTQGMVYRVFYAWMALWCIKCRYYLAWGVAEAAFVASDASKFVWHHGRNIDFKRVETAQTFHSITKYWNICTADWLKRYIYIPLQTWLDQTGWNRQYAIVGTNVVSASWHGISAGYYVTFIAGGFCTAIGRLMHKHLDPFISGLNSVILCSVYEIVMVLLTNVLVITFGLPFELLSWQATWEAWKGLFFIGHVWLGAALLLVLASIVLTNQMPKDQMPKETKIE